MERHGAIRLGTPEELSTIRRLFMVMGMVPVGYYDLSVSGIPVHSTAFRPTSEEALRRNPFRVFTSLLRLDLIEDGEARRAAAAALARRNIFTPRCMELIEQFEGTAFSTKLERGSSSPRPSKPSVGAARRRFWPRSIASFIRRIRSSPTSPASVARISTI